MANILGRLFIGFLIPALGAMGADNSLGTWKLHLQKSRFTPKPPVKSLTTTREGAEAGVKITTTGEQADGTPVNTTYPVKYDGADYPVSGSPRDTISIKHVNASTF